MKKTSGFLEVAFQLPYLALNLVLRVKDISVLLFIYLFILLASRLWVIWNTIPTMTAIFNFFE